MGVPAIVLITNRSSGTGRVPEVIGLLDRAGVEIGEEVDFRKLDAVPEDAEMLIAACGDGTLGPIAELSAERDLPLAVIPAGTANDFAARMGIPAEIEAAVGVAAAAAGRRKVDLGFADGRPFVNVVSVGLAPDAARRAAELKDSLGQLAYGVGAVQAGATGTRISCTVNCDGSCFYDGDAWQVTVAASGAFGGGSEIDTVADDGMLDVVLFEGGPRPRLAKHALGLGSGTVEGQKGVRNVRCELVELSLPDGGEINLDGELVEISSPSMRLEVRAHAFELVIG